MARLRPFGLPFAAALLLLLVALISAGGSLSGPPTQVPTSWVDVAGILAGGVALGTWIVWPSPPGARGGAAVVLFAAVAVLGALSIAWSVAPDETWEEAGRTVAYLGVFIAAVTLARSRRCSSDALVWGLTGGLGVLAAWALLVKLLGLDLYGQPDYGPLLAPFGYWNATGVIGAMALPGLIWIAAGSGGSRLGRGVAFAGIAVAASVVALTYSRSAVAAAAVATVLPMFWIARRRRAALAVLLALLGCIPIWIVGLSNETLTGDTANSIYGGAAVVNRGSAERELLLITVAVVLALVAVGTWLSGRLDRGGLPVRALGAYDRALRLLPIGVIGLVVVWLCVNHRGPFGEITHVWTALTSVKGAPVGGRGNRLASVANSRSAYWREALSVGEHHPLAGTGWGSFYPAYLRYPTALLTPSQQVKNSHSYLFDAFAGLGLIGLVLNGALLFTWARDAIRALRHGGAAVLGTIPGEERDARWALVAIVLAFGVSAALDWTWYFPGVAVGALVAAGWISGVAAPPGAAVRSGRRGSGPVASRDGGDTAAVGGAPRRRPLSTRPGAILALTLLTLVVLAIAWESIAPMRSTQSISASVDAAADHNGPAALGDARAATSEDPLSADAYAQLAAVDRAMRRPAAQLAALRQAARVQAGNPRPLLALGGYLLCHGQRMAALAPLHHAAVLDVTRSGAGQSARALLDAAQSNTPPPATTCQEYP